MSPQLFRSPVSRWGGQGFWLRMGREVEPGFGGECHPLFLLEGTPGLLGIDLHFCKPDHLAQQPIKMSFFLGRNQCSHHPAEGLILGILGAAPLMSLNCHNSIKPCSRVQQGDESAPLPPAKDQHVVTAHSSMGLTLSLS